MVVSSWNIVKIESESEGERSLLNTSFNDSIQNFLPRWYECEGCGLCIPAYHSLLPNPLLPSHGLIYKYHSHTQPIKQDKQDPIVKLFNCSNQQQSMKKQRIYLITKLHSFLFCLPNFLATNFPKFPFIIRYYFLLLPKVSFYLLC